MEPARHPFPVSSTARTIGEQKAKVKAFSKLGGGSISGNATTHPSGRRSGCTTHTPTILSEKPTICLKHRHSLLTAPFGAASGPVGAVRLELLMRRYKRNPLIV